MAAAAAAAEGGVAAAAEVPLEQHGDRFLQHTVGSLLADYGWYILVTLIAVYLLAQKLAKRVRSTRVSRSDTTAIDADVVVRQQEALLAARKRMQEELDAQAEKFKEKQRKLEEEKRRQKIAMWESMQEGKSYRPPLGQNQDQPEPEPSATTANPREPKPRRRPLRDSGYSPLSGEGGGTCSWRPGRRGPSTGG